MQARSIGVDLDFFGKTAAVTAIVSAVLMYPAGIISDRLHPLRVLMWATIALLVIQPLWLIFLFYEFSHAVSHGLFIAITAVTAPAMALYLAAELPMYMRILPKSRYGQFCSANAMARSFAIIIGGLLIGFALDWLAGLFSTKDYCYRFVPLWSLIFIGASLFFLRRLYSEWLQRGGVTSYHPPGFEPKDEPDAEATS